MATNDSGLPDRMPKANGNAKSGDPVPAHVTATHAVPPWMSSEKQKWTKDRVNAIGASSCRRSQLAGGFRALLRKANLSSSAHARLSAAHVRLTVARPGREA
jgi:hypothetical protein